MLIVALVIVAVVLGFVVMAVVDVLRGTPNSGPALGTNRPYPTGVHGGEDEPPYMPNPVISEDEEFRRNAHHELSARGGRGKRPTSTSWMDEPGALERAGLVDASPTGAGIGPDAPRTGRRRKHHRPR